MNQADKNMTPIAAQYYVSEPEQHDEIDLFELVVSIFKQWKLILLISLIGTSLAVGYAFNLSKQYENYTQLRKPLKADLQIIQLNGFSIELKKLFLRFYDNLKSPEVFKQYLIKSNSITEFYPKLTSEEDIYLSVLSLTSNLDVNFIDENNKKGNPSHILQVRLKSPNEVVAIKVINQYVLSVEQDLLNHIRERGKYAINIRKQEIEEYITKLRSLAKQARLNKIADLKETLKIAITMGVKDPLLAVPTLLAQTQNSLLNEVNRFQKYMVGSNYLIAEINRLESRGTEITADDSFIEEIPTLLSELSNLNKKSFNFEGVKLYTLDKLAAYNDATVKPNKKLIAIIGLLLSVFLALFFALIVSTVQKRKIKESQNNDES